MLTAFQPSRKRPSPGQKMTSGGRSLKPAPCPCPIPPAGKGYGRRQHHFLAGKMQRRSELTLLCCLLQTTVIAACALSSICRSFPPFRESFFSRGFQRDPPVSFSLSGRPAALLPPALPPRSVTYGTGICRRYEITGFSVILIRHGKMHVDQYKEKFRFEY